jgi:hypothetical protein
MIVVDGMLSRGNIQAHCLRFKTVSR